MAEVVTSIVNDVLGRLSAAAMEEISLLWGFKDDILTLEADLTRIKAFLQDAKEKHSKVRSVTLWVASLRRLSLKIENLLDEVSTEVIFLGYKSKIKELALGLELTGLPFFLVLNFPTNLNSSEQLKRTLPQGFLERVKDIGIVHSGWVQQRHILAHESVGCYLSHASFNSVIEGLVNDGQLVMLPLKGDQFMNSKLIELEWRVGIEVYRRDEDGYFGKDDVFEAVKSVMMETEKEPAKSIRENHKKWKEFLQNNEANANYKQMQCTVLVLCNLLF